MDSSNERIDLDSFVQIFREIDDLFEDDDLDEEEEKEKKEETSSSVGDDAEDKYMEDELEKIFQKICDKDGFLSKEAIQQWDELEKLFADGLLGEDEFVSIWEKTPKRPGSLDQLDLEGFLSFNVALDSLFDFDELEEIDDNDDEPQIDDNNSQAKGMITDYNLTPEALFTALADAKGQIGMKELENWGELQEWLNEGDLMPLELQNIFDGIAKVATKPDKLDEKGFLALYAEIDSLFEDDDEEEEGESSVNVAPGSRKKELLGVIDRFNSDKERLPCGIEGTEKEKQLLMEIVSDLEVESNNFVQQKQGAIEMTDIAGEWDLLYSTSSAFQYNKGLTGLGGSFPNGRFDSLKQILSATKFMADCQYIEHIAVKPDTASFDVKVNGNWELRRSSQIFTGQPSIVLTVVPDEVSYGPTSTRADHWKSLGPANMLTLTYLDDDIRIMRGNTATDAIFVFRRS